MSSGDLTSSLRNAALEIGAQHTTKWRFLKGVLKLFLHKLQMYHQVHDKVIIKSIYFAQYFRNELGNDSEFLKRIVLYWWVQFSLSEKWTSSIFGYQVQWVYKVYTKLRAALPWLAMVRFATNGNSWTLIFEKWKRYVGELQTNTSILCFSMTSKLSRRHNILAWWWTSLLWRGFTAVLRREASKLLEKGSRSDFLAVTFASIDSMWLICMRMPEHCTTIKESKPKSGRA